MTLETWPVTPAAVLDRTILESNLRAMAARAAALGVPLRPHLKTAKCREVAALAAAAGADRFTVSTLREAEYFFAAGYRDLLYAVAIEPGKFARAAALLRAGAQLLVCCDATAVAAALTAAGRALGVVFPVLIEVDCGEHRSGIAPGAPELTAIADALRGEGAELRGVMSHSGHSYNGRTPAEHAAVAAAELAALELAAARLRAAGHSCPLLSLGSTPVAAHAGALPGGAELRCGVYMFNDLFQAGIGSCDDGALALSVLTAVVGHRPEANVLLIDAGSLALSKDLSTARLAPALQAGYGIAAGLGGRRFPGLTVTTVYQEHGLISGPAPLEFKDFPIGRRLRIYPNHACLTAAAYDSYVVVAGGTTVEAVWPRVNGW